MGGAGEVTPKDTPKDTPTPLVLRRVAEGVLSQTKSFRTESLALLSILRERGKHVGTSSLSRRRWNLQLCLHEKVHGHTLRMSLLSIIPWCFDVY